VYSLSHSTSPFLWWVFQDRFSWTICLEWLQTVILLISASWVARITGVSHPHPASLTSLRNNKEASVFGQKEARLARWAQLGGGGGRLGHHLDVTLSRWEVCGGGSGGEWNVWVLTWWSQGHLSSCQSRHFLPKGVWVVMNKGWNSFTA
jgi:hypothetical protein